MKDFSIGQKEYAQLREAALSSVNAALSRYDAHRYAWMDADEKDDIVSDAFTKAYETYVEDKGCTFKTWLKKIAYQTTIDRLNSYVPTTDLYREDEDGDLVEIPELSGRVTVEDEVIGRETQGIIDEAIGRRSETDNHVFNLHRQGYMPREIAERLDLTPNAASVRLDKMKKAVIKAMAA